MTPLSELAILVAEQHATIAAQREQIATLAEQSAALKVQVASAEEWKLERDRLTERNNALETALKEWSG